MLSGHPWWRVVLETVGLLAVWFVLATVGWFAIAGLAALAGDEVNDLQPGHLAWRLASLSIGLAALIPAVRLAARWLQRRPAGSVSSVEGRLRWRWLLGCTGWAALALALVIGCELLLAPATDQEAGEWIGWSVYGPTLAVIAILIPLQAAGEEYFFRGWLLQAMARPGRAPWLAAVLSTAMFVLAHGRTDPLVAFNLAVVGMAGCWLTVRTGGLEAAIALHVVNNAAGLTFDALDGALVLPDAAAGDAVGTALQAAGVVAYAAWTARAAARRGISARAP